MNGRTVCITPHDMLRDRMKRGWRLAAPIALLDLVPGLALPAVGGCTVLPALNRVVVS